MYHRNNYSFFIIYIIFYFVVNERAMMNTPTSISPIDNPNNNPEAKPLKSEPPKVCDNA